VLELQVETLKRQAAAAICSRAAMLGPVDKGSQGPSEPMDWNFLQCFGERAPGEEVQEGECWGWWREAGFLTIAGPYKPWSLLE